MRRWRNSQLYNAEISTFRLHLTDVSALAVYCSALTLAENGLAATLYAADGLHGFTQKVQHIVTNPPFHTGIKTDYTITKRCFRCKASLSRGGTMQMVANRFLPYPGLLAESSKRSIPQHKRRNFLFIKRLYN